MTDPDLAVLLPSWLIYLQAERKSIETVRLYSRGVRAFLAWCQQQRRPALLDRPTVAAFVAELLAGGAEGATAHAYQKALRQFSRWMAEEGELDADPLLGVRPPKLDSKVVPVLDERQLRALLAACHGPSFLDRRDEALVRLMVETGLRAGETVALELDDVDLRGGTAIVRRGKGGRGRVVPFGPQTARAIDRYLRLRRGHLLADDPFLWLGDRGKRFGYAALRKVVVRRGELAGITGLHPHRLRHTAAHRWLAAGGTEGGLMAVGGWANRSMLDRYGSAVAAERAAEEARRLGLGDL
jgi:integrase/recombinase XerD